MSEQDEYFFLAVAEKCGTPIYLKPSLQQNTNNAIYWTIENGLQLYLSCKRERSPKNWSYDVTNLEGEHDVIYTLQCYSTTTDTATYYNTSSPLNLRQSTSVDWK